jgi:hypothetical protein
MAVTRAPAPRRRGREGWHRKELGADVALVAPGLGRSPISEHRSSTEITMMSTVCALGMAARGRRRVQCRWLPQIHSGGGRCGIEGPSAGFGVVGCHRSTLGVGGVAASAR